MNVTINTDASFSKKHQRGSFAFWIVSNNFKILKSGIIRKKCSRPEIAEFRCIINALHVLFREDCSMVRLITINTDCLNVIHLVTNNKEAIRKYRLASWGDMLVHRMDALIRQNGYSHIKIEMKHVVSHNGTPDARSYVNDWCDKEAKKKIHEIVTKLESHEKI